MLSSYQPLLTATSLRLLNTNVLSLDSTGSYTTNGLTTTNDILTTNTSAANITASSGLSLTGTTLSLNGTTSPNNGTWITLGAVGSPTGFITIGTNDPINTLVDLHFASANLSRRIRQESRASNVVCGVGSFQMGGTNLDAPTFAFGDSYCAVGNKLMVGAYGYPTGNITFYLSGYSHF